MSIRIFVTGGTFDKEYNELSGDLFFKNSHVAEMLSLGRSRVQVDIRTLMMVDSTTIDDDDRELIAYHCLKTREDRIVVTHGTDTMVETAKHIAEKLKGSEPEKMKTIVLTGAMVPYTFGSSDGLFNMGSALAYVQILPPGVYIAMNGRYFDWHKVRKNKRIGEFEETE